MTDAEICNRVVTLAGRYAAQKLTAAEFVRDARALCGSEDARLAQLRADVQTTAAAAQAFAVGCTEGEDYAEELRILLKDLRAQVGALKTLRAEQAAAVPAETFEAAMERADRAGYLSGIEAFRLAAVHDTHLTLFQFAIERIAGKLVKEAS